MVETLVGLLLIGGFWIVVIVGAIIALLLWVFGIHAVCDKLGID